MGTGLAENMAVLYVRHKGRRCFRLVLQHGTSGSVRLKTSSFRIRRNRTSGSFPSYPKGLYPWVWLPKPGNMALNTGI